MGVDYLVGTGLQIGMNLDALDDAVPQMPWGRIPGVGSYGGDIYRLPVQDQEGGDDQRPHVPSPSIGVYVPGDQPLPQWNYQEDGPRGHTTIDDTI